MSRNLVQIMAKAPVPGMVKTRLTSLLGPAGASELYRAMLLDCIAIASDSGAEVQLVVPEHQDRRGLTEAGIATPAIVQFGRGLANALAGAIRAGFALGADRVAVFGSDHPDVPPAVLTEAFRRLDCVEVVIGPTPDGGYYLLAARQPVDSLFQVQMSTSSVLDHTLAAAAAAGFRYSCVTTWQDVDTPADLSALESRLEIAGPNVAPATRVALAALRPTFQAQALRR